MEWEVEVLVLESLCPTYIIDVAAILYFSGKCGRKLSDRVLNCGVIEKAHQDKNKGQARY